MFNGSNYIVTTYALYTLHLTLSSPTILTMSEGGLKKNFSSLCTGKVFIVRTYALYAIRLTLSSPTILTMGKCGLKKNFA